VDNEGDHDCGEQLGLGDVIVGQFVDVVLQSSAPPFAATFVLIRNFSNQVEISVQSPNGESLAGAQLAVHVIEKVVVRGRSRRVSRTLHFRMTTVGGPVRLAGLPTGRAKIEIQGIVGGEPSLGRRRIVVSPDRLVSTRVVLKPVRD
jgi:hypothetical protein